MAINPNPALSNRNALYLARSGGGKSQAIIQNRDLPKSGARVLLWDVSHDHKATHIDSKPAYAKAVLAGLKSGKGFRLAYSGGNGPEDFDWWCSVVWAMLDGNKLTHVVAEELSAVCPSVGKASPPVAVLMNQGRKYGLVFHGTSQKPQEIAKTFYDQCEILWVGMQRGKNIDKFSRELGIARGDIDGLKVLQFWRLDPKKNGGNPEKVTLRTPK